MSIIKHLVPLLFVGVRRDITSTPQTQVAAHEIPILQAMHGESNVYPGGPTGTETALEIEREHKRLCDKYGEVAVEEAYGTVFKAKREIAMAIEQASVGTWEDKGSGIQLEGPDTPIVPRQSLPGNEVIRAVAKEDKGAAEPSSQWTKAQLIEHAEVHGIAVDPDATKAVILAAIEGAKATA